MARLRNIEGVYESKAYAVSHPYMIQVAKGFNARKKFRGIPELAADILERGLDNPLWVRRDPANADQPFILIDGERRHKALCKLFEDDPELELRIDVRVFNVDEEQAEDLMVKSCFTREDFLTSEKVGVVQRYQKRGLANKEIAERLGMSIGWVDQMAALATATKPVKTALDEGKITVEAALMLARKTKQASQEKALTKILAKAAGKRSATAKAAAEVTGTSRRPGKKEVVQVIKSLATSEVEAEAVTPKDARKLVILALNFAAGDADREALLSACSDQLKLKAPEPEPEAQAAPEKPKRGRKRKSAEAVEPPATVTPEPEPAPESTAQSLLL